MNGRSLRFVAALVLAVLGGTGCCNTCCRRPRDYIDPPTPSCPSCQTRAVVPGVVVAPPEPRPLPGAVAPSVPVVPETRGYAPLPAGPIPVTPSAPADAGVRLSPPAPAAPPQSPEPPRAPVPVAPGVRDEPGPSPALPSGIAQFAPARPGVSSGLKPSLEGLEWLRTNGYRAVLHVRLPGAEDAAERRQFERLGIRYLSVEVSPQTLSRDVVERFSRPVGDPANQPLFVYDRDGTLAGGLWYLYFVTVSHDTDEVARLKAARLGLKEDTAGPAGEMWLAIQKYLSQLSRGS
jgi:protein tyrosine phosphatase (PTP) superfamily phosphohydrolase (DUF442 family)